MLRLLFIILIMEIKLNKDLKEENLNNNKNEDVPFWQIEIVLKRLEAIKKNPKILEPIENFFD